MSTTTPRYAARVREYDTPNGRLAYVAQIWDTWDADAWRPVTTCDHAHRSRAAATTCADKLGRAYDAAPMAPATPNPGPVAPARIMCASCSVHPATGTYAPNPRDFAEYAGSCMRHFAARDDACVYCATDHVFLCRPCTLGYIHTLGTDALMRLSVIGAEPLDMCNRLDWLTAVVGMWNAPTSNSSDADARYRRAMLSACRVMIARLTEGN